MAEQDGFADAGRASWVKIFAWLQALLLVLLLNPWSEGLRWTAVALLTVEALFIILWGLPVFFYSWAIKKKSLRESWRDGVCAVVNLISFSWWV